MDIICSLVHFCDIHGPTSIICTQALPGSCDICHLSESTSSCGDTQPSSPHLPQKSLPIRIDTKSHPCSSPFATPPGSPQSLTSNSYPALSIDSRRSDIEQRYGGPSNDDSETCGYCSLSLPKDIRQQIPEGAPGSPTKDGKGRHGSPIMRSRERICAQYGSTPPGSEGSEDGHISGDPSTLSSSTASHFDPACRGPRRSASAYSDTPPLSRTSSVPNHSHTITYLTTRFPSSPSTYTTLRHSTLRTLSCETLAPGNSSGPLLFGDTDTGYTIAYKFRCTDPSARGGVARYALTMLVGKSWRRAGMVYGRVVGVFERLAERLMECAEMALAREAKRERMKEAGINSHPYDGIYGDDHAPPATAKGRTLTPVSSFLDAKTVDPDGVAKRSSGFLGTKGKGKIKGLAEIVGEEGFFVECHVEFVRLLSGLGMEFGWSV